MTPASELQRELYNKRTTRMIKSSGFENNAKPRSWKGCLLGLIVMVFPFLALISMLSDSFKPTAFWIKMAQPFAFILGAVIFIFTVWAFPINNDEFSIRKVFDSVLVAFVIALSAYLSLMYSTPMLLHEFAYSAEKEISVVVTDRQIRRRRRFTLCKYQLLFEHPDMPHGSYVCASESTWDQTQEGLSLKLRVENSLYGYTVKSLE